MKKQLRIIFNLMFSFMLLGCFGQNSSSSYDKKRKEFTEKILKNDWNEPDKIKKLIEPTILISDGKNSKTGGSKLGGTPDLPNGIEWPKFKGQSMVFYGQINLKELAEFDQESLLPKTGVLYFFSYFKNPEDEYGASYEYHKDKSEYKVLYFDNELSDLENTEFPKDLIADYHFKPMPIDFHLNFQVPQTVITHSYENANLNSADAKIYEELLSDYANCEEDMIIGTPCPIQSGADYDWAYSYTKITDFQDPMQIAKVDKVRPEFVNLLSFTMVRRFEKIGYSNCYFGIRKEDLKNKAFDEVIFILQDS